MNVEPENSRPERRPSAHPGPEQPWPAGPPNYPQGQPVYPEGEPPYGGYQQQYRPYASYPTPPKPRITAPEIGWAVVVAAAVLVIGSVLPWATALGGNLVKHGTSGDGAITIVLGTLTLIGGLLVLLRHGRLWVPIVVTVLGALAVVIAIADIADVHSKDEGGLIEVGSGLWITLVGGILITVAGVAAIVVRREPSS